MRLKTWLVAALGLGSLLLLIAVSMLASSRKAQEIYTQLDAAERHTTTTSTPSFAACAPTCNLSGIFVRDYLLDIARERAPEYRQRLADVPRDQHGRRSPSCARSSSGHDGSDSQPAGEARRLLVDVRSAVRLDAGRKDPAQRQLPAPRGRAAARSGAGDRAGDRGTEQREPRRTTRRSGAAAWPPSATISIACSWRSLLLGLAVALVVVFRLRVLERRSEEQRLIAKRRRAPDARAVAAAGRHAGRGAQESVARAARSRRRRCSPPCAWSSAASSARDRRRT